MESNIQMLFSSNKRDQGLSDIKYTLESSGFGPFENHLEYLFEGFKAWLLDTNVDNLLLWYQVLITSLPEVLKSDEVEHEFIKILPLMLENLGSQKTVVRKSTHRWIASYVKLSLKLELVLKYIIRIGLVHNKHRTRQHSMLVIPALLSLKKTWVKNKEKPIIELVETVAKKLFDSSEIVQKTAKKLLIELRRVYPDDIISIIKLLSAKNLRNCCYKILDYELESESEQEEDDDELEQPIQKTIQKQQNKPTNIKTDEDYRNRPIIDRSNGSNDRQKVQSIKEHFNNDKLRNNNESQPSSVTKPIEQPKVVYENNSSLSRKHEVTATKSKPFKVRETPKKTKEKKILVERTSSQDDSPVSRVTNRLQEKSNVQRELDVPQNKFQTNRQEEQWDIKALSNTQTFDRSEGYMNPVANQNIRKSMQNLRPNDKSSSKESEDEEKNTRSISKQSAYSSVNKQTIKPALNNSSSQSSISKMSHMSEIVSKAGMAPNASGYSRDNNNNRHDTINIEKQTTKPLIGKAPSQEEQLPSFGKSIDTNLIKPNLTQSVHHSREYGSASVDVEEMKTQKVVKTQPIKIEKQESDSEPEEQEPQPESDEEEDDQEDEDSEEAEFPVALNRLVFSFLPQDVAESLNEQSDWKKRTTAIQKMESLIKKQLSNPNEDFPIYITDICRKMWKMMHDSNFKISLTSLRILHSMCLKYPNEVNSCLKNLATNLSEKLSDNKIVIRHTVLKVFYALMTSIGANDIIQHVFPYLENSNWHIREEILSILIMGCVISNSTCGLSDPKLLSQICQMVNDDNKKVSGAAFEALCLILSKDSSTAIILNSYLDPKVYNSISERCLMGILATVNYDGIVEFPTSQRASNNENMLYRSKYSHDPEVESVQEQPDIRKHTQSVDQTYQSNPQSNNGMGIERGNKYGSAIEFEKTNSTTHSIGNKMWLPAFNMTASSIQSKQSVRVSQEPYMQTPNQYMNKGSNLHDRNTYQEVYENKSNYTPEVHQSKPRTFANVNNPSMTTHSMNTPAQEHMMLPNQNTGSTRSNTFYSKENMGQNPKISDKLKILKSSAKMKPNNTSHSPISQPAYANQFTYNKVSTLSDYNPTINNDFDRFSSEKKMHESRGGRTGPIRATEFTDMPSHASLNTEILHSNHSDNEESLVEQRPRYSQHSNKSIEPRSKHKASFSQKKPPIKGKKSRTDVSERPLSVDAKSEESEPEKFASPEAEWKSVLKDIVKKNDWEKQFKACNTIKDFSTEHPKFFSPSDPSFSEIMAGLSNLCNSLRTQLSRNALGTFAQSFDNLGKKMDCILDTVIPMLLKKAADTNAFIAEEAEKALVRACENCSETKIVSAALSLSKTKVNGVKEKILVALNTIIEKLHEKIRTFKDKEKIISFLASGMNEAALEVRNAAKSGFLILKATLPDRDFEKLIMRSTSDKDYAKVLDFIEKESTQTDKFMITNGISTKGTFYYNKTRMSKMSKQSSQNDYGDLEENSVSSKNVPKAEPRPALRSKISSSSSGYGKSSNFELIDNDTMTRFTEIIKKFDDNDWKKRIAGLKALSNFIQEEEKLINKSKKFFQIVDVLVQCLKDNNTKVVAACQDIFSNVTSNISTLIEKGSAQIIEALWTNAISSNSLVKNCGQSLIKKLVLSEELECSVFIPPMWNQILQGNTRGKPVILAILTDVVEIVYEIKPIWVTKHIFGLCSKLLDDSSVKGDTKRSLYQLIGKLYELAGESFVNSFPSRNTDKVWTILKNETNSIFG